MDKKSCIYAIHESLASLSLKERKVADFILAAPADAVHPSIEELSDRIGVSESTLFRFVRKLGYEGYQQFRIALATETSPPNARFYDAAVESADGETAVSVVFKTAMSALELTMKGLDRTALEASAELLVGARMILFLGLGGSGMVARDAYHKLLRTGLRCSAPEDFHVQLMSASQAAPQDVALLVSHSGANTDALALAAELKRNGVPLVLLCTYQRSPLAKMADQLLISAAPSSPYASEAFSARIAQLAIVDALYVEVMERLGDAGMRQLDAMRAVIAKRRT
ncbi:MAG TPA: MurR/RpiR family transcriptional regulator [Rectinemataceae bacterium]|nr:MurR/RpiR family transcriptional regulator [Rectinemataceae bacterium]